MKTKNNGVFDSFSSIEKISSGISFDTYRALDNNKSYIIKLPKNNKDIVSIKRLQWQFNIQKYLCDFFPVPQPFNYGLGKEPFIVMQDICGISGDDQSPNLNIIELLINLHNIDTSHFLNNYRYAKNTLKKYTYTLVKQYETRKTGKEIDHLAEWLLCNIPQQDVYRFIHNDLKMSNIIFHKNEVASVIDWELSQISDPRIDLGIAMSYWSEENKFKRDAIDKYFSEMSFNIKDWSFFEVLGLFRKISIAKLIEQKCKVGTLDHNNYEDIYDKIYLAKNRCERIINS